MANFCGKCGCRLDETTGLCPNCSPKAKRMNKSKVKLLVFSVALILVLGAAITIILSYFHIINLPILSSLFEKNTEVISFDNEDTVYHPDIEQIEFDEENNIAYFNNLLVVYTVSDLSEREANELAKSVNGTVVGDISGSVNVIQIRVEETTLNELNKKSETLMQNNKVLYAGYDYPIEIKENNPWNWDKNNPDTDRENESNPNGNDWWAEAIGAYTAWDSIDSVEKIKVGILDSGYDLEHEDLQNKITFLEDYPDNTEDDHGTHVAGIIAANNNELGIRGIVDNAELICVDWSPVTNDEKSSDYVNYLSTGEYIEITKQLVENGAKVINNSWGSHVYSKEGYTESLYGESNDLMFLLQYFAVDQTGAYESYLEYIDARAKRTAIDSMLIVIQLLLNEDDDFLIVQSAGNGYDNGGKGFDVARNGFYCAIDSERYNVLSAEVRSMLSDSDITYQTIDDHIMIVGATQNSRNENGSYKMTGFSNFGDNIDICAPGQAIYSAVANNGYDSLSGTSMAGPVVAGSAALVWSDNPHLTAAQVKRVLLDTSTVRADGVGDGAGRNYPIVNVGKAVQDADFLTREKGTATLTVVDSKSNSPIQGVKVEATFNENEKFEVLTSGTTNKDGTVTLELTYGSYTLSFIHNDYNEHSCSLVVETESTVLLEPILLKKKENVPNYDALLGTYKGSYFANQGETGLTLTIFKNEDQYKALFDFYNLPGKNNAKNGKYYMNISYDKNTGTYYFDPYEWISKPSTYEFVALKGKLTNDVLSGDSPTRFSVTKTDTIQTTPTNDSRISLETMPIVAHDCYKGNQGDSTVYNLNGNGLSTYDEGKRFNGYGNVGLDGTTYTNGFEVWIARWNYTNEISWASATFKLDKKYTTLTGKTNLIGSYNTTNFDTTIYFYNGDILLGSYRLTNKDYIKDVKIDVSGVSELRLLVQDNVAVSGGTSFALYDMFLDAVS